MSSSYDIHQDRAEVNNYLVKTLGNGAVGEVFASIPRADADRILLEHARGFFPKKQTCDRLRAVLEALKIPIARANVGITPNPLAEEIKCLRDLRSGRSHIVRIIDAGEQLDWFTLELLTGGTLRTLENKVHAEYVAGRPCALPAAFGWHLIAQAAQSLLELHFGIINNDVSLEDSTQYTHGDILSHNMAFRIPGRFADYPDFVLIDFETARVLAAEDQDDQDEVDLFFATQADEVWHVANVLIRIMTPIAVQDPELMEALQDMMSFDFDPERDSEDSNDRLSDFLAEIRDDALRRRVELYAPLQPEMNSNPLERVFSDEELAQCFPQLR